MKIALVSPYDFSYPGGVTVHISHLEHYFTLWGHQVRVLAPCSTPPQDSNVIPIGRPIPVPSGGSIARITLSLTLDRHVKEILEGEKFDVVHIHEPLTPMLALVVLRLSRSLNIGTFHAYHEKPRGYGLSRLILRRWMRRLDGKIAVSEPARQFISRHFPGEYTIIPNGVDLEHFTPRLPAGNPNGQKDILFVGRLEKRKGLDYLLGAYQMVKTQCPQARLLVVGPGTRLRQKYERLVQERQLQDVVFTGYISYEELPRYYDTAEVFCAPATGEESFGMVLLEAMAMGKPVVATAIDGYSQLVSSGKEGLLVPPKDEDALAKALLTLMDNPALCQEMGARGRARAQEYSWERVARRVMDYYQELLARRQKVWSVNGEGERASEKGASADWRRALVNPLIQPLARPLAHIHPNLITLLALLLSLGAATGAALGQFLMAGIMLLLSGLLDLLDGAVARASHRVSRFGGVLDSTMDRLGEAVVLLGLLVYFLPKASLTGILLVNGALVTSFLVSYIKARAEGAGLTCPVGLFTRAERVVVLALGLLLGQITIALGLIVLFSLVTAAQRLLYVWRQSRGKDRG